MPCVLLQRASSCVVWWTLCTCRWAGRSINQWREAPRIRITHSTTRCIQSDMINGARCSAVYPAERTLIFGDYKRLVAPEIDFGSAGSGSSKDVRRMTKGNGTLVNPCSSCGLRGLPALSPDPIRIRHFFMSRKEASRRKE